MKKVYYMLIAIVLLCIGMIIGLYRPSNHSSFYSADTTSNNYKIWSSGEMLDSYYDYFVEYVVKPLQ